MSWTPPTSADRLPPITSFVRSTSPDQRPNSAPPLSRREEEVDSRGSSLDRSNFELVKDDRVVDFGHAGKEVKDGGGDQIDRGLQEPNGVKVDG